MASKEFCDVTFKGGAPELKCSCGRYHIGMVSPKWADADSGERSVDKMVVYHEGSDSVGAHLIGDDLVKVSECECDSLDRYERFIVTNREMIIAYYKAVSAKAKRLAADVDGLES
jgi:hypothetical protein